MVDHSHGSNSRPACFRLFKLGHYRLIRLEFERVWDKIAVMSHRLVRMPSADKPKLLDQVRGGAPRGGLSQSLAGRRDSLAEYKTANSESVRLHGALFCFGMSDKLVLAYDFVERSLWLCRNRVQ